MNDNGIHSSEVRNVIWVLGIRIKLFINGSPISLDWTLEVNHSTPMATPSAVSSSYLETVQVSLLSVQLFLSLTHLSRFQKIPPMKPLLTLGLGLSRQIQLSLQPQKNSKEDLPCEEGWTRWCHRWSMCCTQWTSLSCWWNISTTQGYHWFQSWTAAQPMYSAIDGRAIWASGSLDTVGLHTNHPIQDLGPVS